MGKLFEEFKPISDQEWIDQISKDLKGKSADEIAKSRDYEGFDLKVFYTAENQIEPLEIIVKHDWIISDNTNYLENTMADPIHHLMTQGDWMTGEEQTEMEAFESIFKSEIKDRNLGVDGSIIQLAGASAITELAITTAHLNEYLHFLHSKKLLKKDFLSSVTIKLGIGSDYFMEIAKFRAIRILVRQLAKSYGIQDDLPFEVYAKNSLLTYSAKDPNTNILRSTTACMSAVIGGCDHLILQPHDKLIQDFHDFGDRIARNIQLMMKHEAHLDKIVDAASGSYYLEWLTKKLSEEAWKSFQEIEENGGLIESFKKGVIQSKVKAEAIKRIENLKNQKDIFIGINKYQINTDSLPLKSENFAQGGEYEAIVPLILEDTL